MTCFQEVTEKCPACLDSQNLFVYSIPKSLGSGSQIEILPKKVQLSIKLCLPLVLYFPRAQESANKKRNHYLEKGNHPLSSGKDGLLL